MNEKRKKAMAVEVSDVGKMASALGMDLDDCIKRLAPLDSESHDSTVQPRRGSFPWEDTVRQHFEDAQAAAEESLKHLRASLELLDGILRGEAKDRYQEPVSRGIIGAEQIVARLDELNAEYIENTSTVIYGVRQNALAGLALAAKDLAREIDKLAFDYDDADATVLAELSSYKERSLQLMRTFTRLRDNPSRKMETPLREIASQIEQLFTDMAALVRSLDPDRIPSRAYGSAGLVMLAAMSRQSKSDKGR